MTTDLHPTPSRLALLREVAADRVTLSPFGTAVWLTYGSGGRQRVTARIQEMTQAGWVELPGDGQRIYQLTDAGRALVAGEPS